MFCQLAVFILLPQETAQEQLKQEQYFAAWKIQEWYRSARAEKYWRNCDKDIKTILKNINTQININVKAMLVVHPLSQESESEHEIQQPEKNPDEDSF